MTVASAPVKGRGYGREERANGEQKCLSYYRKPVGENMESDSEHKKKYAWEILTYTRPKPVSLNGYKAYDVTYMTDKGNSKHYCKIMIWSRRPIVAMKRIISKKRSEYDLNKLDGKIIDDMDL